jgi:hypothetical protein
VREPRPAAEVRREAGRDEAAREEVSERLRGRGVAAINEERSGLDARWAEAGNAEGGAEAAEYVESLVSRRRREGLSTEGGGRVGLLALRLMRDLWRELFEREARIWRWTA